MSKKQVMAEIIRHTSLSDGIFDMTLKAEEIAKELDLKKVSYVRKLRSRSRNVTKDSLLMNEKK